MKFTRVMPPKLKKCTTLPKTNERLLVVPRLLTQVLVTSVYISNKMCTLATNFFADKKQALGKSGWWGNMTPKPQTLQEGVQYSEVKYTGWLVEYKRGQGSPSTVLTFAGHPVHLQWSPPSS